MKDSELNHQEASARTAADADGRAYRAVFNAAGRAPDFQLPSDFVAKVVQRVAARQQALTRRERVWLAAMAGFFILLGAVCVWITGYRPNLTFLNPVKGFLLLGAVLAVVFQWLDRTWVRPARQ
jgi:hypothetical protein